MKIKTKILICLIGILLKLNMPYAQTCNQNMVESAPETLFTNNGNGTVTDTKTGLTWMQCSLGQTWDGSSCSGFAIEFNWKAALEEAENETFNESSWRLPNIKELSSIVEDACYDPAINQNIFPQSLVDFYWSSTPATESGSWSIGFYNGHNSIKNRDLKFYARLVRIDIQI